MLYSDKDFEYYDMHIKSYLWNPLTEEFELICLYQNKETAKILLGKVKGIEDISRFEDGIVKYVQHNKDDNGNLLCFEFAFQNKTETVKVYADTIRCLH